MAKRRKSKAKTKRRVGATPERCFAEVMRLIRKRRKLSQDEFAFRSGYHRTYVSLLERGQRSPSLRTIFDLATTLRISPAEIVRRVEVRWRRLRSKNRTQKQGATAAKDRR